MRFVVAFVPFGLRLFFRHANANMYMCWWAMKECICT